MVRLSINIDFGYRSLFHHGEELCGDKVEMTRFGGSFMSVLADGMGSGVKANILSTMTSKILITMLSEGESVESAVETVTSTLPICSERHMAYCTFSVVQVSSEGEALLVEFDNPGAFLVRNRQIMPLDSEFHPYSDKAVFESTVQLVEGDWLVVCSDGVMNAGAGNVFSFNWTWNSVADWLCENAHRQSTALRLANSLLSAVNDLYGGEPGDDATAMVLRIPYENTVNLMYGPPADPEDDERVVAEFMQGNATRIVCGGSTSNLVARVLGSPVETLAESEDEGVPPISFMDGVDLVTEGVLTVTRACELMEDFFRQGFAYRDFKKLDAKNGAAMLARQLIEDCTHLRVFIGTARNAAHDGRDIPQNMTVKMQSIDGICRLMEKYGRTVEKIYY